MKLLAFCILPEEEYPRQPPPGPDGRPLPWTTVDGLAAVFSLVPDPPMLSSVPQLLNHARVVEAFHRRGTVLPLRFGSLFDHEAQLRDLLRRRAAEFHAALRRVKGCAEIGLRVLLPPREDNLDAQPVEPVLLPAPRANAPAGMSYLDRRKAFYAQKDRHEQFQRDRLARIRTVFDGLFVQCAVEPARGPEEQVLALAFLVPRDDCELFLHTFRQSFASDGQDKVLLTGPWPPYTFAQ